MFSLAYQYRMIKLDYLMEYAKKYLNFIKLNIIT